MNEVEITLLKQLLSSPKKIAVIPHKNPDGDAMGSTLALYQYLIKTGHQAAVVAPNDYPDFLKWLPFEDTVIKYDKNPELAAKTIAEADLIFTLDFNHFSRTGELEPLLKNAKADFILIDHHQQPDNYALVTYSDVTICATCQMVYHTLEMLDAIAYIDSDMASCLYAGIMTDTGSFRFSNTTSTTHDVIAKLIAIGADGTYIHEQIYDSFTPSRIHLLGKALSNLKILPEYNTAYISLSQKELDDSGFQKGDTEGFVNYGLAVKGIVLAAIFIESASDNIIKISLRSKDDFSVNEMSRAHFNGGGHTNAAGGKSDQNLADTISYFISILPAYKKELNA